MNSGISLSLLFAQELYLLEYCSRLRNDAAGASVKLHGNPAVQREFYVVDHLTHRHLHAQNALCIPARFADFLNRERPQGYRADKSRLDTCFARAVNRRIDILYEFTDGTTKQDDIEDPLPFDLNAPVVKIEDEDYALFYRDITEEPDKYKGKTVEFKGQVAKLRREKEGMFAPGRFVMTCCEADITFMGIPCRFVGADGLKPRSWVTVRAEVEVRYHNLYHGVGPILNAISISPAEPAQQQVATF